ncbi:MAG: site-specific integrase [Eubacterium sp.]|nr:site-specific integrase [Eubacterium sp.]
MPAYRDKDTGKWFTKFYCTEWSGKKVQIKKRGFETKKEALEYERNYKVQKEGDVDVTFGEYFEIYREDVEKRLKRNSWLTKEHMVRTKILPYFKDIKLTDITPKMVMKWQNQMIDGENEDGIKFQKTYIQAMHNQLSAIFNHAMKYYGLRTNPARVAGNVKIGAPKEMLFWTKEEYKAFSEAVMDKPYSFYAFEVLYWTGIRLGELLALTKEDFDLEKRTLRINKSFQRLEGKDVITEPKTPRSVRTIKLPRFLAEEMEEYFQMLYRYKDTDRIFVVTKSFLHHEMDRGVKASGVKRIRIHDLRHSHVSLLIDEGFTAVDIAARMGHESQEITYRYAHMFPSKQDDMADMLDRDKAEMEDRPADYYEKDDEKVIRMEDYNERKKSG